MVESVSIIFVHKNSFFTIKRQFYLKDFPGYTAFPGGKVETKDHNKNLFSQEFNTIPTHLLNTCIREINEELTFNIIDALKQNLISSFDCLGYVIFPSFSYTYFKHYYFSFYCTEKPLFTIKKEELYDFAWSSKSELLALYRTGDLLISNHFFPLLDLVSNRLKNNYFQSNAHSLLFQKNNLIMQPLNDVHLMPILSHRGFGKDIFTNVLVIGNEKSFIVDPAPLLDSDVPNLLDFAKTKNNCHIFLSHAHIDHIQSANIIANKLRLPLKMSLITHQKIVQTQGKSYFKNIEYEIVKTGDVIGKWLDQPVRVFDLPGHQAGHLGFAPDNMKWFFVGDLVDSTSSVVVEDMAAYMNSLELILKLDPKVIISSHGVTIGGTFHLSSILKHRKEREKLISDLYNQGHSSIDMLNIIYPSLNPDLKPLAEQNILAHLKKLGHT